MLGFLLGCELICHLTRFGSPTGPVRLVWVVQFCLVAGLVSHRCLKFSVLVAIVNPGIQLVCGQAKLLRSKVRDKTHIALVARELLAAIVKTLRIEWPSGAVQEFADVAANQLLTVWEPPVMSAMVKPDCSCQLTITAEPNCAWQIQASTDLKTWQTLATVTNTTAIFQYTDPNNTGTTCRFYRAASE